MAACFTREVVPASLIFVSSKAKQKMKIHSLVLSAAMIISNVVFADAPVSLDVIPAASGNVFTVYYKTPVAGEVKVSILNRNNVVVFSESLNDLSSFKRPYNFSELQHGEYTIVVEDKNGKREQKVSYESKKITSSIRIAQVSGERNKFMLNVMNNGAESVRVRIYDNAKGLVHEQEMVVSKSFGLVYNLEKVRSSQKSVIMFEVSTESGKVQTAMF